MTSTRRLLAIAEHNMATTPNGLGASPTLTDYARVGYDGNPNPHLATSPAWYAHALGRYLHDTGRTPPRDVRMGRGDSIRCNDMRFRFGIAGGRITFVREE